MSKQLKIPSLAALKFLTVYLITLIFNFQANFTILSVGILGILV